MLNYSLQVAEYLFIAGSIVGWIVAIVSGQLIYAAVPFCVYLLLNLINRIRFERRTRRRLSAALAQLRRQLLEETSSLNEHKIREAIASLQAQLPEYLAWIETPEPDPSDRTMASQSLTERSSALQKSADRNLIQLKARIASLEKTLSSIVQYLNSASLPTRVERLEDAIASASEDIVQIYRQLPNSRKKRIDEIERRHSVNQSSDIQTFLTQSAIAPQPFTEPPESVSVESQNVSPPSPTWSYSYTLRGHTDWIYSIAISPNGQTLASGSFDKTIKLWELSTGSLLHTLSKHSKGVCCVAISPDGQTLASGSWDETIKLWRLKTGELIGTLKGHTASVRSLVISPDNQTLVSGSFDETIKLWYMDTGECLSTIAEKVGQVCAIALTPDGQTIASGGNDGLITLRQLDTTGEGKNPAFTLTLTGNLSSICAIAISPDGQILAAGCTDGNVKLWQLSTGTLLDVLEGHAGPVMSVVFSVDGQTLISGSADGTIEIRDLETRAQLAVLTNNADGSVMSVAISSDGQLIAGGGADSIIKIWQRN